MLISWEDSYANRHWRSKRWRRLRACSRHTHRISTCAQSRYWMRTSTWSSSLRRCAQTPSVGVPRWCAAMVCLKIASARSRSRVWCTLDRDRDRDLEVQDESNDQKQGMRVIQASDRHEIGVYCSRNEFPHRGCAVATSREGDTTSGPGRLGRAGCRQGRRSSRRKTFQYRSRSARRGWPGLRDGAGGGADVRAGTRHATAQDGGVPDSDARTG